MRWPSGVSHQVYGLAHGRRHLVVEPTVTTNSIGALKPIGTSYLEIPVTVHNHSPVPEATSFKVELSLGSQKAAIPAYHFPATLNPSETRTVSVYVPIRAQDLPIADQLGVWMKVSTVSRSVARDERTQALR